MKKILVTGCAGFIGAHDEKRFYIEGGRIPRGREPR